jgi:two-component sensor histidine kinase
MGFGTRLIQRGLAAELNGSVEVRYEPGGVQCEIQFPLAPDDSPPTVADGGALSGRP